MNIANQNREEDIYYSAPLESYIPLETSVSLETTIALESLSDISTDMVNVNTTSVPPVKTESVEESLITQQSLPQPSQLDYDTKLAILDVYDAKVSGKLIEEPQPISNVTKPPADTSNSTLISSIPLSEERVVVNRTKHKLGEVVIRKEIETHIVEVPIRREKLIIEQVNPVNKRLAEVDLEAEEISERELLESLASPNNSTFTAEFNSVQLAAQFLGAIATTKLSAYGSQKVQLRMELVDPKLLATYEQWLHQFVASQNKTASKS